MIGKIIGALIGRSIDRRDGRGGIKGMIFGAAAARATRRMGPWRWVLAGLYGLWRLFFGRRSGKTRYR